MMTNKILKQFLGLIAVYILALCLPSFVLAAPKECRIIHHEVVVSEKSREIWDSFESHIMTEFNHNLGSKSDYGTNYSKGSEQHVEILRSVFGLKVGLEKQTETVVGILNEYEKHMNDLVTTGKVKLADILLPAFVFKNQDGTHSWIKYGSEIPPGAKFVTSVLTNEVYDKMISEGFFPVGDATKTPTSTATFEHDLAHLTSFIQSPEYMHHIKRTSIQRLQNKVENPPIESYEYFLNEGLMVFKKEKKKEFIDSLLIPEAMKSQPDQLTLDYQINFLKAKTQKERENEYIRLAINDHKYVLGLGGASREPFSAGRNSLHSPLDMIQRTIVEWLPSGERFDSPEQLAKYQIVLLKLSNVELREWFDYGRTGQIDKNSNLYKLFEDKRLWEAVPELRAFIIDPKN